LVEIRELLVRELRAACSAAIARGTDPAAVDADLAARARRMRVDDAMAPARAAQPCTLPPGSARGCAAASAYRRTSAPGRGNRRSQR
jgi:hypothetical protein